VLWSDVRFVASAITFALHEAEHIAIYHHRDIVLQTIVEVTLENIPVTFGIVPVDVREHGYLYQVTIEL
jgi:hypothetical protein